MFSHQISDHKEVTKLRFLQCLPKEKRILEKNIGKYRPEPRKKKDVPNQFLGPDVGFTDLKL